MRQESVKRRSSGGSRASAEGDEKRERERAESEVGVRGVEV
jgi:hypothetical protein